MTYEQLMQKVDTGSIEILSFLGTSVNDERLAEVLRYGQPSYRPKKTVLRITNVPPMKED